MITRRRATAACLVVAIAMAWPLLARADDPAWTEAQARFKEGVELANGGKYEAARVKFMQSAAVVRAPAAIYNLASADEKTGRDVEAIQHYRAFLTMSAGDPRITAAARDGAVESVARLLGVVARVIVEAPEGARVTVDGVAIDDPKEPTPLAPGPHTVQASFRRDVRTVTVECPLGVATPVTFDFEAPKAPAAPAASKPNAAAMERGRSTAGYVFPIATGVLGVAGIVSGVAFALTSYRRADEAAALTHPGICATPPEPACATLADKLSSGSEARTAAIVSYVVGGVFLAGSFATFVFWPRRTHVNALSIAPRIGLRDAGASMQITY